MCDTTDSIHEARSQIYAVYDFLNCSKHTSRFALENTRYEDKLGKKETKASAKPPNVQTGGRGRHDKQDYHP